MHNVNVINVTPEQTVAEQDATWGKDLFARNPDQCCALRKVAPLGRALRAVRGLGHRAAPGRLQRPGPRPRSCPGTPSGKLIKVAPIATWTDDDVRRYVELNSLMINPLLEDGYASIGCEPCTVKPTGRDARAGRWAGLAKTECGIHL